MGQLVEKKQCPSCAESGADTSQDNLAVYDDGTSYCFACSQPQFEGDNNKVHEVKPLSKQKAVDGDFEDIKNRGIEKSTCEKYGVKVGFTNEKAVIYNFYENGLLIDQKVRGYDNKSTQYWTLGSKTNRLFGMDRQSPTTRVPIIITEGEYDAMCIYQETGLPSVSVTKGAAGAAKQVAENLEWLQQWQAVILCFDMDEAGQRAVKDTLELFDTLPVKVCKLPMKDANDMVMAGRGQQLKKYIWDAEIVRKPSVVRLADIRDRVLVQPKSGKPWPWPSMTEITFGMRMSEISIVVAAQGIGKTEFIKEIITNHIHEDGKVAIFSLEQTAEEVGQRLAAGYLNKPIYIPDNPAWNEDGIKKALDKFDQSVYVFDTDSGNLSLHKLELNLKFLKNAYGVDLFILDNLTAFCAYPYIDGKRMSTNQFVEAAVARLQVLTRQLKIHLIIAAHVGKHNISTSRVVGSSMEQQAAILNRSAEELNAMLAPPGSTWESGRVPNVSHILGAGTTANLADHVIALSRNKESDKDIERRTTNVKFIKTGRQNPNRTKNDFKLLYDYDTGKLEEI